MPFIKLRAIVLILTISISLSVSGQNNRPTLPSVIPPPPEAAALEKFVTHPVDLYHGIPEINIPLFNVEQSGYNMPIALKYHAGGIKVEEIASWVGMGWALNAGGIISRTINGVPDDTNTGYVNGQSFPICGTTNYSYITFQNAEDGNPDLEPDVFTYSLPNGIAGRFVIGKDQKARQMPQTNLKIEISFNTGGRISGFVVTDTKGIRYEFNKIEEAYTTGNALSLSAIYYNASWHLSAIKFPGLDSSNDFTFEYSGYTTESDQRSAQSESQTSIYNYSSSVRITQANAWRISAIRFKDGSINFIPGAYREDLKGSRVLNEIVLRNKEEEVIKKYRLNYNYFSNRPLDLSGAITANTIANPTLRLALKNIQESGKNDESKPPYQFEYNDINLPNRLESFAIDHWGYYNGRYQNTTLIPDHDFNTNKKGDRNPSELYAQASTLTKITYPTGGNTSFKYELNKVNSQFNLEDAPEYLDYHMTVRPCGVPNQLAFTVKNIAEPGVKFQVRLEAYVPTGTSGSPNCAGSQYPITVGNVASYLMFRIYKASDLAVPVSSGSSCYIIDGTNKVATDEIFLPNGDYVIKVHKGLSGGSPEATNADANSYGNYNFGLTGTQYEYLGYKRAGGIRILEQVQTDPVSTAKDITSYEYKDDFGNSSGIINAIPAYDYSIFVFKDGVTGVNENVWSSLSNTINSDDGVGYSKVSVFNGKNELTNEVGIYGKTESYYSIPMDLLALPIPNGQAHTGTTISNTLRTITTDGLNCYSDEDVNNAVPAHRFGKSLYPFAPLISQAWRRGYLDSTRVFAKVDSNYVIKSVVKNTYKDDYYGSNNLINRSTDLLGGKVAKTIIFNNPYDATNRKGIQYFYYPSRLKNLIKTVEESYDEIGVKQTSKIAVFEYADLEHLLLTQKSVSTSDAKEIVTQYKYPTNYQSESLYQNMYNRHIWEPVIEESGFKKVGDIMTPLMSVKTEYKEWSTPGLIRPFILSTKKGNSLYSARVKYSDYTVYGNPKEISKFGGPPVCYLWSYFGNYPIAEITNASYNAIENILGTNNITDFLNKNPSESEVKIFLSPLKLALPEAIVTMYSYKIFDGVTSTYDAKGMASYYTYDNFQRLKNIKDQDSNFVKSFVYNYKKAGVLSYLNVVKSAAFTKNNCGSGFKGNDVIYSVPAGTFTSDVSQLDADNQAVNSLQANGQAYANAVGTCVDANAFFSVAVSGNFVKNNCPSGQTGSAVVYQLPAGAYNSRLSQTDADNKANADIVANGQNFANNTGICSISNIEIPILVFNNSNAASTLSISVNGISIGAPFTLGAYTPITINASVSPNAASDIVITGLSGHLPNSVGLNTGSGSFIGATYNSNTITFDNIDLSFAQNISIRFY